jgi:hypothetical protein
MTNTISSQNIDLSPESLCVNTLMNMIRIYTTTNMYGCIWNISKFLKLETLRNDANFRYLWTELHILFALGVSPRSRVGKVCNEHYTFLYPTLDGEKWSVTRSTTSSYGGKKIVSSHQISPRTNVERQTEK